VSRITIHWRGRHRGAKLEMYRDQGQLGGGEFKLIREIGEGEKK